MSKITASIGSLFSNLLSLLTYLYSQPGCQDNVCRTAYSRNCWKYSSPTTRLKAKRRKSGVPTGVIHVY